MNLITAFFGEKEKKLLTRHRTYGIVLASKGISIMPNYSIFIYVALIVFSILWGLIFYLFIALLKDKEPIAFIFLLPLGMTTVVIYCLSQP